MSNSKELWLPRSGYYAAIDDSGTRYSLLSPDTAAQARALKHEVWGDLSSLRPLNGLAGGDPEVFVAYGRCTPSDEVTLSSCSLEQEADPGEGDWIDLTIFRLGDFWVAELPRQHRWYWFRGGSFTQRVYRTDRTRRPTPQEGPGWFRSE